jgi:hypothetical protein
MKKVKRARLSIDLDAWPEVRDMLQDAMEATHQSATQITILALRKQLPAVARDVQIAVKQGVDQFLKRHKVNPGNGKAVPNGHAGPKKRSSPSTA